MERTLGLSDAALGTSGLIVLPLVASSWTGSSCSGLRAGTSRGRRGVLRRASGPSSDGAAGRMSHARVPRVGAVSDHRNLTSVITEK